MTNVNPAEVIWTILAIAAVPFACLNLRTSWRDYLVLRTMNRNGAAVIDAKGRIRSALVLGILSVLAVAIGVISLSIPPVVPRPTFRHVFWTALVAYQAGVLQLLVFKWLDRRKLEGYLYNTKHLTRRKGD